MMELRIVPYQPDFKDQLVDIVVSAWAPVFERTRQEVPGFVYDAFWPQGWQTRQVTDVLSLVESEAPGIWMGLRDNRLAGFVGVRMHPDDQMGEVSIVAVSPDQQRKGIGRALMEFAERCIRERGMKMVMVETVGDSGHAAARRIYEALGYEQWPVARYFKQL